MDVRELYQEVILDHNKRPRNYAPVPSPTHSADGHNPLCGDVVHLTLHMEGGVVRQVGFQGKGCAISTASASLMTDALKGRTEADARRLFASFQALVTTEAAADALALGKLAVFAGVREFPMRVKCATLAWHTLMAALDRKGEASTE